MKVKANMRRGSILMEFIVVFPIYLILFAGLFMLGDMLLRPLWLAEADRVAAHDVGEVDWSGGAPLTLNWNVLYAKTVSKESETDGMMNTDQDNVSSSSYTHYADPSFEGPWSLGAGAKALDDYSLFELTRGQLASVDALLPVDEQYKNKTADFATLLNGDRVTIYSKDRSNGRVYNYYTYKRAKYKQTDLEKTYRAMPTKDDGPDHAGRLVDAVAANASWNTKVWREKYAELGVNGEDGETSNDRTGPRTLKRREYQRYNQFVQWSN